MADIKVTYIDHMGGDLSVVNSARVSFGKTSEYETVEVSGIGLEYYDREFTRLKAKDAKLIKYLANHGHTSPFGHAFASFHVKAPIFVARQLVKHKFLRWNEISRRYVDDTPEVYIPSVWRGKSTDKKQGSSGEADLTDVSCNFGDANSSIDEVIEWHKEDNLGLYEQLIEAGVAPEQARMVLPQSTLTEWFWSGSLDAFADLCRLRLKPDTQEESRIVAQGIDKEMAKLFPVSWEELMKG
jgi:thymidylate synthase (FAD)